MLKITRGDKEFFLRAYQQGDEKQIISLISEFLGTNETLAHWQWKYLTLPAGSLIILATDTHGTIIGHMGFQRKKGWYYGAEYLFYISEDVVMKPKYRGYGLFGSSPLLLPSKDFIILGFPNEAALHAYKKFPIDYSNNFFFVRVPVFTKTLHYNLWKHRPWKKRATNSIEIRKIEITKLDLLDRLWEEKKDELNTSVIRDAQYLKWRMFDCPREITLYELRAGERCIGYFSITIREKVCFVTDILVLNAHLIPMLIECIEDLVYSLNTHMIQLMINDKVISSLLREMRYSMREEIICTHFNIIEQGKNFSSYLTYSDTDLF